MKTKNDFWTQLSATSLSSSIATLMKKTTLVVPEEYEFEYGDESKVAGQLETSDYQMIRGKNRKKLFFWIFCTFKAFDWACDDKKITCSYATTQVRKMR